MLEQRLAAHFIESAQLKQQLANSPLTQELVRATRLVYHAIANGHRIFACGNGGSASDSQHFVAELVGRFKAERIALPAISLTTDTSILTAVGNDYGYEQVFSRQIEGLGQADDVLVAISTSGNSPNVLRAINAAKERDLRIIGLSGRDGGAFGSVLDANDVHLCVPHPLTARIQEVHILLLHCICDGLDALLLGEISDHVD